MHHHQLLHCEQVYQHEKKKSLTNQYNNNNKDTTNTCRYLYAVQIDEDHFLIYNRELSSSCGTARLRPRVPVEARIFGPCPPPGSSLRIRR